MKQETKKASKVVNAVELSTSRVEFIDNAIGYEIQVIEMDIVYNLAETYSLEKPKSPNVKSEQKSEQRQKIEAMTDAELKAQGKIVELAKREEKRIKNAEKLENQDKKDFVKNFKTSMENLAKNEYDFAMYINSNINMLREQFLDSQS